MAAAAIMEPSGDPYDWEFLLMAKGHMPSWYLHYKYRECCGNGLQMVYNVIPYEKCVALIHPHGVFGDESLRCPCIFGVFTDSLLKFESVADDDDDDDDDGAQSPPLWCSECQSTNITLMKRPQTTVDRILVDELYGFPELRTLVITLRDECGLTNGRAFAKWLRSPELYADIQMVSHYFWRGNPSRLIASYKKVMRC
jgi:hypothetical protein